MTTDTERIDGLESRLAFQDDTIQQLNDALVAQQARIDALEAELEQLIATLRTGSIDGQIEPVDEVPPHY